MAIKYDTIDFKIKTLKLSWKERECCVIYVNGKEILPIIKKKEQEIFAKNGLNPDGAGTYNYLTPHELYIYLSYADLMHGDTKVPILCCCCDEVGCASIRIRLARPGKVVIWKDFEGNNKKWNYGLKFNFDPKVYETFMNKLKTKI
ncbi:MAG: hypothetical protein II942_03465 [Alphaproteobacteria bacterium]|nr:hypothetical protein [Alphaproteobacteria bacterium]